MRDQILRLVQKYLNRPLRPSGPENMLTYCPFHKGGQETTPSFSINVEKGLFHCFTCHESGSMKKFLRLLGVAPMVVDSETRILQPLIDRNSEMHKLTQRHAFANRDPFVAPHILPETLLSIFDRPPTKLINDGFDQAVLRSMQVGYDTRGERIIYPLRDVYGNLAGFSGGATRDGQWPKYKVYQGSRRDPNSGQQLRGDFGPMFDEKHPGYTCENHLYLWGFDTVHARLSSTSDMAGTVFVVEGFKACMWMKMAGFTDTVALMGSYISDTQQRLLHRVGGDIVLFLDNDRPGRKATMSVGDLLWKPKKGHVHVVRYPEADILASDQADDNTQPDDYELEVVRQLVRGNVPFIQHFNIERSAGRWE